MLSIDKIFDAQSVLKPVVRKTNVVRANGITDNCDLFLKPENLQHTGSFKLRGSGYMISQLTDKQRENGVIACSAGNHAQGVALAATKYGIKSLICLPGNAPISKVEATKKYGAEVELVGSCYDDAYARAIELAEEKKMTFVHPFDNEDVIIGQGTIALEVLSEMDDVDAIIAPIGGGGLISGIAFAVKNIRPSVKVYGVQMEGAPSMYNSIKSGKIETLETATTIADGIAVKEPGKNTFEIVKKYVDDIALVSDDDVASAILSLIERQKMIAEGAGAAGVAAVMANKFNLKNKRVVAIVSGGNIDVTSLNRVIDRGLMNSGRSSSLLIELVDKPGQLKDISRIIADCGGNVTGVHYEKGQTLSINGCFLRIELETRNFEHVQEIKNAIVSEGFILV